ncbi:MAG: glycosyltransferase [Planctomycetia bacterium]|nr:glycosyltransferase [Planctomycetia bacterium]
MTSQLSLSVAMCTYNGERFLQEQLDSLTRQERLPDELVVCDDGSTDKTWEILEKFAEHAPFPVRLYRNEKNLGYNQNFEQCALKCSGDVIFFCDQDDIWYPEKIRLHMEIFEKDPEMGMVFSDSEAQGEKTSDSIQRVFGLPKNYRKKLRKQDMLPFCRRYASWVGHCISYRTKYHPWLYPLPEPASYDRWIFIALNILEKTFFLEKVLVVHRIHPQQVTAPQQSSVSQKAISYHQMFAESQEAMAHRLTQLTLKTHIYIYIYMLLKSSRHYSRRALIREKQQMGLWYAILEFLNGGYFRHSRGFFSFLSDFLRK